MTTLNIQHASTVEGDHFIEHPDLFAVLSRGSKDVAPPVSAGEQGTVVISLAVDGEHDEINLQPVLGASSVAILTRAIESLENMRESLREAGQS